MMIAQKLVHIAIWGGAGALLFTALVLIQYASGLAARITERVSREGKPGRASLILLSIVVAAMIALPAGAAITLQLSLGHQADFLTLWTVAYGVVLVSNLWDLLVLDLLLTVLLRPSVLHIPESPSFTTADPHIRGFFKSLILGIPTSLIATLIAATVM